MSGSVSPPTTTSRRILVVEDDALVGLNLTAYLEDLGAQVTWATSVEDAIPTIERNAPIDIAIVDLNLHGVRSDPVLDHLLSRNVFTILCTGYDGSSVPDRFRALPRSEKPFTLSKIRTLLGAHL